MARLGDQDVAGIRSLTHPGAEPLWGTYIRVVDVDAAIARVNAAGGTLAFGPLDVEGGRMAACSDPAGAAFWLWEAHGRPGAELVNAPGTWNWSNLEAPDPEAAEAFYGAVFGWEALPFGPARMWRLPGYSDVLAAHDPELRKRHAEAGVPEGFSDAIGWLGTRRPAALDGDVRGRRRGRDRRPRGRGSAAPSSRRRSTSPSARIAVLRDPAGAELTVSRYAP